ncbi:MAG: recombinase RecT [Moritella sp.]|uniref:recombinase RecT n=1 Tax=Moritella sp. TaxID=78556 RepID=UPI001D62BE07|nr:recombinase RecT [Moritella sp.]NQZ49669.1 recombinase RecT [Moritella sp.]
MKKSIIEIMGVSTLKEARDEIKRVLFRNYNHDHCPHGVEATESDVNRVVALCEAYGLNPYERHLYIEHNDHGMLEPILRIDGWYKIANAHPDYDGFEFFESEVETTIDLSSYSESMNLPPRMEGEKRSVHTYVGCKIYRKSVKHSPIVKTYFEEVFNSQSSTWLTHPKRRLQQKAFAEAVRIVLGVNIFEAGMAELSDSLPNDQERVTPEQAPPSQPQVVKVEVEVNAAAGTSSMNILNIGELEDRIATINANKVLNVADGQVEANVETEANVQLDTNVETATITQIDANVETASANEMPTDLRNYVFGVKKKAEDAGCLNDGLKHCLGLDDVEAFVGQIKTVFAA